ncbi:unnamed protein product [Sphagnum jensenii]|uniref:ERCC4 domain-containing protein n=1 Tax=Sphagnum jensenii TaxID=128206 RepID=A0ABP0WNG3_9BRYO
MLGFHEQMVSELVEADGVTVLAAGLGLTKVLASLLRLHVQEKSDELVLLLSTSDEQRQALREELQDQDATAALPLEINNEYTSLERMQCYAKGGVFFITSRILIVDMLNERVPLSKVAGVVVNNAHRLSESCAEAFIVRLFRHANKVGFVRAFSDKPQAMVSGFSKTERVMKSLFVKRLYLWPRFHLSVSHALEEAPPEVVDIRMPLTSAMAGIQNAIIEVMDACLKELRKTNKVDVEDLTVDNGLFKSFDEIVRRQLDPMWHTVGWKTKQLVGDLKTLRKLSEYLLRYDAVTFLKYLDTLRASEGVRSVWIFANPTHKIFELTKRRVYQLIRTDGTRIGQGKITQSGRGRGNPKWKSSGRGMNQEQALNKKIHETDRGVELEVVVEEMPKWKVLREVLEEIEEERQGLKPEGSQNAWGEGGAAVLVACKDDRMCLQLQDVLARGPQKLMQDEWTKYLLSKAELHGMRTRNKRKPAGYRGVSVTGRGGSRVPWEGEGNQSWVQSEQRQEQDAIMAAAAEVASLDREVINVGEDISHTRGLRARGRGRGRSKARDATKAGPKKGRGAVRGQGISCAKEDTLTSSGKCNIEVTESVIENQDNLNDGINNLNPQVPDMDGLMNANGDRGLEEEQRKNKPIPPVHFYALESEQRILEVVRPVYVVVYDPDMSFVREMEVYKSENPGRHLKVYFLFYEDSTEGRKFEASIRRENSAFENLIRQKASMMIPVDQDGRMLDATPPKQSATGVNLNAVTRKAGGRKQVEKQMQVVVDMREFGSSLPCVLHQQGIKILPVTLEVGDYILSPDICVERKSIADLFSSFSSGRLYHQAETMSRYYRLPVLLIEFSQDKSFSFQSANDVGDEIAPSNIVSKLSLLVLHFPRLRIVWSRSLHATADIFVTLKANQDEPDLDRAMRVGVPTEDGLIEGDLRAENYNTSAIELLRRLPGVTDANYRSLMDECKSLAEVALLPAERLAEVMGGKQPARMLRDFLDAKCPILA